MNPVADRDRALRRLSRLTTSAGVAGVLATAGFGGLAAATYRGHTSSPPVPDTQSEGTSDQPAPPTSGPAYVNPDGAAQPSLAPVQVPVTGVRHRRTTSITPPTLTSGGGGHVTSGGSG